MKIGKICKRIMCVTLAISMVALSGCTTFDSFKHTFIDKIADSDENTIYFGVFEPQTGKYKDEGLAETKGIELANSIYHSVDGYNIELIKVDTQSSTSAAETAIQGLIKMKPVAIIGSVGEAESLMASKYVEKAKIPTIAPSSTNPLITQNCKYYFRASLTSAQMGAGVAEYVTDSRKSNHVGIVTIKNDTNVAALIEGFYDKLESSGKKKSDVVAMTGEIDVNQKSFKKIVENIKKNNVDTVFVPMGTEKMHSFFKQMEKAGLTGVTYIGISDWGKPDFVEMMDKHPLIKIAFPYVSAMNSGSSTSDALTEEAQRFQIQYASEYGNQDVPTDSAALGYDSYLLLINAIHNAGSIKGKSIRKALLALEDVKCSTGVFKFDDSGNTVRTINISTLRGGKVVSMYETKDTHEAKDIEGIKED